MQKKYLPLLLPTVLSGCAGYGTQPPVTPALVFIDGQISESATTLAQTQQRLSPTLVAPKPSPAATGQMPATEPPATRAAASSPAAGQQQRLSRLVTTGSAPAIRARQLPVAHNRTIGQWVKQLLPDGWQLRQENAASPALSTKLASWAVNDQWPYALNRLLAEQHLWGHLDWQKKTLTVTTSSAPPAKANTPATSAAAALTKAAGTPTVVSAGRATKTDTVSTSASVSPPEPHTGAANSKVPSAPTAKATPPVSWTAIKGATLRKTLNIWASQAPCPLPGEKWQVRWQASVDYPIDAPFSVSGSWKQALMQTFALYSHVRTPLLATVYMEQCFIEVKDRP